MSLKLIVKIIAVFFIMLVVALTLSVFTHQVVYTPPLIKRLGNEVPRPGSGDPGNIRLNGMVNDKVFSILPPSASPSGQINKIPAKYRAPAFESAGWDGPAVEMIFTSADSKAVVYPFYAARAAETGWKTRSTDRDGYIDSWTKINSDGSDALLVLFGPTEHTYRLSASAPAID